jgi:hypothetical protein
VRTRSDNKHDCIPRRKAQRGTYLTIWRREHDGSWKAVFDTGIPAAWPASSRSSAVMATLRGTRERALGAML